MAAAIMLKGLTTAYLLTRSYQVKEGDTVLFTCRGGRRRAAGRPVDEGAWRDHHRHRRRYRRIKLARANGYDHVIDYRSRISTAEVMRITDGCRRERGFGMIFGRQ